MSIEKIQANIKMQKQHLCEIATKDEEAYRNVEQQEDMRTPFFRDIDRIIYTTAYTRYMDKTQVFSLTENDNITKRITHVQLVSKVARTIGRALRLNEDLIEAIALGHDIGHVPFGHVGEMILNKISLDNNEGYFNHNVQSVRHLQFVENYGRGENLTIQVLDGILCHNGELELEEYHPIKKTAEEFWAEYYGTYTDPNIIPHLIPMTIEGCVVRVSDIIGYIGRDLEDAIRLGIIKESDIPYDIKTNLGKNTKEIVNKLVMDIIENSIDKDYIKMSNDTYQLLKKFKKFSAEEIYKKANNEETLKYYEELFNKVFYYLLENETYYFNQYLNEMNKEYNESNTRARKVIDYISGMTDNFIIKEYNKIMEK